MKKSKIGKHIFSVFYWLLFFGIGVLWGWHGWLENPKGIAGLIGLLLFLVLTLEAIKKKCWPKAEPETKAVKEPWLKIIVRTTLQLVMGGSFSFGVVSIIFALIQGNDERLPIYIGCIGLSIVLTVILIVARPLQDQQAKTEIDKAKRDFRHYGKDERLRNLEHKAGYITLGVTLMLLLVFGAFITVFPPANYNIITVGILGIFGIAVILLLVLYGLFDAEKLDGAKKATTRGRVAVFLISLAPPALMGIQWAAAGLTNIGIAFFAVFVCVAAGSAVELWYHIKYR
ncbi:MAG: hypothetical protein FWH06_05540 [Oscillospiraceae bacterium]|nr:hypothetical protein [Oscillospiraceae bacterium]